MVKPNIHIKHVKRGGAVRVEVYYDHEVPQKHSFFTKLFKATFG